MNDYNAEDFVFCKMVNAHAEEAKKIERQSKRKRKYKMRAKPFWKMTKREVAEGLIGVAGSAVIMVSFLFMALIF